MTDNVKNVQGGLYKRMNAPRAFSTFSKEPSNQVGKRIKISLNFDKVLQNAY
jgi:hypothetical protein